MQGAEAPPSYISEAQKHKFCKHFAARQNVYFVWRVILQNEIYKLIRELSITPDLIFYPERSTKDSEVENLIRRLYNCDERSLEVVKATAIALIETAKPTNDDSSK